MDTPSDDVAQLLAAANLNRIRRQWQDAIDGCMEALCVNPSSAAAHSLLGDIYTDQGRLDDAIQWYCLAIDLDPVGQADRVKLSRAIEDRKRQLSLAAPPLDIGAVKRLFQDSHRDPNRTLFWTSEKPIRVAVFLAVVACLSAIVAWPLLTAKGSGGAGISSSGHRIDTNPIFLSPFTGQATPSALSDAAGEMKSDPVDAALKVKLAQNGDLLSRAIEVTDAVHDPRSGHVTITFVAGPVSGSPLGRGLIVRDGIRVALAASAVSDVVPPTGYTLRTVVASQGGTSPLAFVGDILASDVLSSSVGLDAKTDAEIESRYASVWWSTSLPPDAAPVSAPQVQATSATAPAAPVPTSVAPGTPPSAATPAPTLAPTLAGPKAAGMAGGR